MIVLLCILSLLVQWVASAEYDRFENWAFDHTIVLNALSQEEHDRMFENWRFYSRYIDWFNSKNQSYTLAHNQFSGMDIAADQVFPFVIPKSNDCEWEAKPSYLRRNTTQIAVPIESGSDSAMIKVLNAGKPVHVKMEVSTSDLLFYKAGVFTSRHCGVRIHYDAVVIGYGYDDSLDEPYYMVNLGWGLHWGEEGIVRLARGAQYNRGAGQCGILLDPMYFV